MEAEELKRYPAYGQASGTDATVTDEKDQSHCNTKKPNGHFNVCEKHIKTHGLTGAAIIAAFSRYHVDRHKRPMTRKLAQALNVSEKTFHRGVLKLNGGGEISKYRPGTGDVYLALSDRDIQDHGLRGAAMLALIRSYAKLLDGKCWASYERMSARLGVSRRTVIRTVKDLLLAGAIRHIPGKSGQQTKAYGIVEKTDKMTPEVGHFDTGETDKMTPEELSFNNSYKPPSTPGDGATCDDLDRKNSGLGRDSERQRELIFVEKIKKELRECGYPLLAKHLPDQALTKGILGWREHCQEYGYKNICSIPGIAERIIVNYAGHPWGSCSLLASADALYLPGQANIDYSSTDQAAAWW